MNEFILFKIVEITTCYKLISTYYNVHYKLRYFVQCYVILGANNNCKLSLNVKRNHPSISVFKTSWRKYVFQSDRQVLSSNIISR